MAIRKIKGDLCVVIVKSLTAYIPQIVCDTFAQAEIVRDKIKSYGVKGVAIVSCVQPTIWEAEHFNDYTWE